jgi:DNA-binding GntR family transcriptional regulator
MSIQDDPAERAGEPAPVAAADAEGRPPAVRMPELARMPSRRSQVIETLRAAIIDGEMQPRVVYSAPALAAQFGISPTPVREAMLHLANEGLIEVARNKGFRVIEPSDQDLDEIAELRQLLEPPAVRRITERGVEPAVLAELERLAQATLSAARERDITGHVTSDIAFHSALLSLAGNRQLVEIVRALRSRSRLFGLHAPEKTDWLLAASNEHLRLLELVRGGDAPGAERLMGEHIAHVRKEWSKHDGR